MKKKKSQGKEIIWNLVNSGLAGAFVFLGALSDGRISKDSVIFALVASFLVVVAQFKDYWKREEKEYSNRKIFSFIKI